MKRHGASFWTRTLRVTLELADGSTQSIFLKAGKDDLSREMLRSEYEGCSAIYPVVPDFIPRPIAWGTYRSDTNTHYYMAEFVPMSGEIPEPQSFCAALAKLHKNSIALSKNGMFGFHVTTYAGTMPNYVTWCDTWEESFTRGLQAFAEQEKAAHGPSDALEEMYPQLFSKVIPRLLRPLTTEGRTIKPVLIHGDLWCGNMATNANTGDPVTFDPSVLWAHNECQYLRTKLVSADRTRR